MPAATILLAESDASARDVIAGILAKAGYTVNPVATGDEVFARAAEHQLLVVDLLAGEASPLDLCRQIRSTPALAHVPVLCVAQTDDVDARIALLETGADDVIAKPFDGRELEARVEALLLRFQHAKDLAPVITPNGSLGSRTRRMVAVFSPKGGVGTTTIATNIALAVALRKPDTVCIVDLDLPFGQVTTHLNLTPRHTIADTVREPVALHEPETLRTFATRHDAGLHVLPAPAQPELAELVTSEHVDALLTTILGTYDNVVIDAGSDLDERTMTVFEHAEVIVLPVLPEMAALKAVHSLLDYLNESGSVGAKTIFVLNNMFAKEVLRLRDVESSLGAKVAVELPYDSFLYLRAVNEGDPIVASAPHSAAAERFVKLTAVAFGEEGPAAVHPAVEERRGRRFGSLIRR